MIELSLEMIAQIRECRARKNITLTEASEEIGISRKMLGLVENEKITRVRQSIYIKLTNWLVDARKPK
ncbi:helix-turn-helix domain-containing protein [Enterococcus cecorum]|uniref:helix-turn-helix domain-containing protein n=1 Tax=Enterococcus cecorum TaxID=44008 RepID=UPI0025A32F5D|nr:helix-turn-helix domain-containing protein [Enterococcus cecorum]MDM8182659.1 helix-turn-helix domain-containing protein [Enterococcus cecorum]